MRLRIGDVINTSGTTIIERIIQWFTKSKYNHTMCYIGKGLVVNSNPGGVKVVPLFWFKGYSVFRHNTATLYKRKQAVNYMINKIGCDYDYLGLLGIGINMLLHRNKNSLDNKTKYWCSELVADGYINVNIITNFNKNTIMTSPADFAKSKHFKLVYQFNMGDERK